MTHDPFAQVRQAHRICGAYYQQILPMINEVAQKIETSFSSGIHGVSINLLVAA